MLGAKDNSEGQAQQDQRDGILNPNAPAIHPFNRSQQQRFKCPLRLAHGLVEYRSRLNFFRPRIQGVNAVRRQFVTFDDGVAHADEIIESFVHLQLGGRCGIGQHSAAVVAQFNQQINCRAPILGVGQQRNNIALFAGESPGDLADRRHDIGFIEVPAEPRVVFQVDIVILHRLGFRHHLGAELAAAKAIRRIKIKDKGDDESQNQRHDHCQHDANRLPAQLHHKEKNTSANQHINQQDILPGGSAGHLFDRAIKHGVGDE